MELTAHGTAHIDLERAHRYAKQLTTHLGRHYGGEWSSEHSRGWIQFKSGRAAVAATDDAIAFDISAVDDAMLTELVDILERHLARFADNPELTLTVLPSTTASSAVEDC